MSRTTSCPRRDRNCATAALHTLVAATIASISVGVLAQSRAAVDPQAAQVVRSASAASTLERTFWVCDHVATRRALDSGEALACSVATEELKRTRFGGDFEVMLAWWQRNKPIEHRALDAAGAQTAGR